MQQMRPVYGAGQVSYGAPIVARRKRGADDAAYACSRDDGWLNSEFVERFDNTDVSQTANSSAAQRQSNPFVFE